MEDYKSIIEIAEKAGKAILEIYDNPEYSSQVEIKADDSPLTLADKAAHIVIMEELTQAFPQIPIISEEGRDIPYNTRSEYSDFWLVDPLDGTKEFIRRNGEFTVNIALIKDRYPIAGVIHVPVQNVTYYGDSNGAYKIQDGHKMPIKVSENITNRTAVRSRSHASEEEETVLNRYGVSETISKGSSLKFCAVAEGVSDVYYRHGPTMEWDTAAGQAIIEAAGGRVYVGNSEDKRFIYNKENLLNPGFLCLGFSD